MKRIIARAIPEKSLSEYLGNPILLALSQTTQSYSKDYYKAKAGGNEWLSLRKVKYHMNMLKITSSIKLNESEIKFNFIRAPGPGGQNVNKVATAVQLRFNVLHSPSLPETVRVRLLFLLRNKISSQGEIIIKATRYRTQERNKKDAIDRLLILLRKAAKSPKKRKKTKPSQASKERRLTHKKLHSKIKSIRGKSNLEL